MASTSTASPAATQPIQGRIIEADIKPTPEGVWLCAYYGMNRSVFDYLPQKGASVDESRLGIVFHVKEFVAKEEYQPAVWEEFKKKRMMAYGGHGE
jgi:hypothetical protein